MAGLTPLVPNSLQPARGAEPSAWQATVGQAKTSTWESFKGFFKTSTSRDGDVVKAQVQFGADFHRQVATLGRDLSPQARAGLEASAGTKFSEIMKGTLDQARSRETGQVSTPVLRQAILQANQKAQVALMQLQVHALHAKMDSAGPADLRPQAYARSDGSINVIRQAPQIENLVLRGGGAKGIGTGPALVEMERGGMLSGLQRVVGTSAGALTAVCLASGRSAAQFQSDFGNIDMNSLKLKPAGFEARYPEITINHGWLAQMTPKISNHAGAALELLDQASAGHVASYLEANWNTEAFQTQLAALGPEAAERLGQLRQQDFTAVRTDQMITFRDLQMLHAIDPGQFKELTLTGWNETNKSMRYFDVASTPDMPIALAGRISMSIPTFFSAVSYDMKDGQGMKSFVDGGVGSNMPSEAVFQGVTARGELGGGSATAQARARTALVGFDEKGKAYTTMHGGAKPAGLGKQLQRFISGLVTGTVGGATGKADNQKLHEAGPNGLVVFHGNIDTLDLNASKDRVTMAQLGAQMRMLEQVEARQNQAYASEFGADEAAACFASLNDTERAALVAGGPPERPRSGVGNPAAHFQMQLYEMAVNPETYNARMRQELIA